jgi:hypothetical protein
MQVMPTSLFSEKVSKKIWANLLVTFAIFLAAQVWEKNWQNLCDFRQNF